MRSLAVLILMLLPFSNAFTQEISIGARAGFGSFNYETGEGRAYLREFPNSSFGSLSYGLGLDISTAKNLFFAYNIRYMAQQLEAKEVVLPPFVYDDYWAHVNIDFTRIQNFIGVGYELSFDNFSIRPQFDFMFSFSNDFKVDLTPNENSNNTPVGDSTEPNFSVGVSEYGIRVGVGLQYSINENFKVGFIPNWFYGEMELEVQGSSSFAGGDNITKGFSGDLSIYYKL